MSSTSHPVFSTSNDNIKEVQNTGTRINASKTPSTLLSNDIERSIQLPQANSPPDGGTIAWLVVLGAWCTSFCSFGWLNSIGVFQEYYQNELLKGYSPSSISWIPSLQIFFTMGLGPFVGAIYDHYGPRWLLIIGTFLHIFGIMMASLGTEYYQILLAQGVCSPIGVASIFQPAVTCVVGWFNEKRGAALGILFTGSSIGGVIFPILVSHLITEVGFGWAMRICAFLMLFLLIIAAGMDANLAQYLLPILNAGSLFGRLLAGFLGDKIGRYNIFIVVCYLSGIWILALWLPGSSNAALIAFAILFGFFSGAYVSLITPLVMQISPMKELGFRTGIVIFVAAVGGFTTNPINGAILDDTGGWDGLKVFSGVFCIVGTTFVLAARIRRTGWKLWVRF
ncbi:major facilitator superfamily transporter protein [Rutstroemia sp. NJR-2017a BBW]|nr:major facilitator superfamily transporter protein [Rutstroemia sp. NJR-2017a BBW]